MRSPGRYRAVNATHEGIHNDDVAAALGYRGGLVTGHAIISCVMDHAQAHWPGRWTSAGSLRMWFGRPVYDGDDMYVIVDDDGTVAVTTDSTDSSPRATGKIADLDQSVFSGSRRAFPAAPRLRGGSRRRWPPPPIPSAPSNSLSKKRRTASSSPRSEWRHPVQAWSTPPASPISTASTCHTAGRTSPLTNQLYISGPNLSGNGPWLSASGSRSGDGLTKRTLAEASTIW